MNTRTDHLAVSEPSTDEIAARAYFIAMERHAHGRPGEPSEDWIQAERELKVEDKVRTGTSPSPSRVPVSMRALPILLLSVAGIAACSLLRRK